MSSLWNKNGQLALPGVRIPGAADDYDAKGKDAETRNNRIEGAKP